MLNQRTVANDRFSSRRPGQREEVVWQEADQDEEPEVLSPSFEDEHKDEGQHRHHDERVDEGPEDPKRHIPVADLKVLLYESAQDVEGIVHGPNGGRLC